ncbi:hypothetical protein S40285_02068 [Stachybotrys chlorohalonatus IBT 40285]|uniref:Protein-S-isoprenylcysteine O-methyltransferase n=1 Tax=Stachybotrys chlorohalonatus (strain IBT 40285) TaxID=1283841 RepID=A0A084R1C5_STAC4|nr:hypothetical protein S40285_02068 [Stachybotrys chlorohalonata IBT 40285]
MSDNAFAPVQRRHTPQDAYVSQSSARTSSHDAAQGARPRASPLDEHLAAMGALHMKPFFPRQPKSLSGVATRAFCLGSAFAASLNVLVFLVVYTSSPAWRLPFFVAALSAYHFLEFWTTAERNTLIASNDSYLLTANWPSYAIAHTCAFMECLFTSLVFPHSSWAPFHAGPFLVALGLVLVLVGQFVRSRAMLEAGASFNHHVQTRKAASHQLVTSGIYGYFRHPSYFGFFYWGLGTQLVMGNVVCFVGYAVVLWQFFRDRIAHEEAKLVDFFQDEYVEYRKRVSTWLPFIR